ncbi:hypothetical protein [Bradyrhizobium viridifuturi]|uniref:hypothetical protein n=1 Tax=Bradyrhizobium viridifuturi TaxID=1654716 RepID=UPI001AEC38B0|nr:hypothetical protein [Bradyrhizobium viridifuturi]
MSNVSRTKKNFSESMGVALVVQCPYVAALRGKFDQLNASRIGMAMLRRSAFDTQSGRLPVPAPSTHRGLREIVAKFLTIAGAARDGTHRSFKDAR